MGYRAWIPSAGVGLNLSLNKHVAWGKLLTYSVPQFLHLQGIQNNISVLLFQYLFSRYLLSAKHWGLRGLPADLGETDNEFTGSFQIW